MAYAYISRSLFKSDRLMFAMHLSHGMFPKKVPENVKRKYSILLYSNHFIDLGMGAFYRSIRGRYQRSSISTIMGQ